MASQPAGSDSTPTTASATTTGSSSTGSSPTGGSSSTSPSTPSSGGNALAASSPLTSEQGSTTIADDVVAKVAGIATREVAGVYKMGGTVSRVIGGVTQRMGGEGYSQGVHVEVGERQAAVDLTLVIEYGESIPRIADEVRQNVARRIEGITGLQVTEVNIKVNDLHIQGDSDDAPAEETSRVN